MCNRETPPVHVLQFDDSLVFISLPCSLPSLRTTFSVTDKKFTELRPLSTVRISSSFIVFHRLSSPVILLSCSNFLPSTLSHTRTLSIVRCHTFNSLPVPGRHPPTRSFISPSSRMMSVRVFLLSFFVRELCPLTFFVSSLPHSLFYCRFSTVLHGPNACSLTTILCLVGRAYGIYPLILHILYSRPCGSVMYVIKRLKM